jgi:restriction system protein
MWPTPRALKALGGSGTNEEILSKIIELGRIPEEVQAVQSPGHFASRLDYNVAWAKSYLKKVGAIDNSSRAVWSITKEGAGLTEADMPSVRLKVRKLFDETRRAKKGPTPVETPDAMIGDEEIGDIERDWKEQLLEVLRGLAPDAFERLAQRMLREAGFIKVEVTGRSGDGGIDGIGVLRVNNNLLSFHVLFQCKRYQGGVGAGDIRDFRGAMVGRSDKGLFMTTGTFTPKARKEATRDGAPPIDLIDGDQLCDLLRQLRLGVRTEMVEKMIVEPSFFTAI